MMRSWMVGYVHCVQDSVHVIFPYIYAQKYFSDIVLSIDSRKRGSKFLGAALKFSDKTNPYPKSWQYLVQHRYRHPTT